MLSDDSSCSTCSILSLSSFFTVFSGQFTDYSCDVSLIVEEEIFYHYAFGKISFSLYMVERISNLTYSSSEAAKTRSYADIMKFDSKHNLLKTTRIPKVQNHVNLSQTSLKTNILYYTEHTLSNYRFYDPVM